MAIYNTEDFLHEAIDSIVCQTIGFEDNVELVLVDDGSTDASKEICLEYKEKYPENINYIYQKNQGQATARNNGMKVARGKYLNFLDSDDKLELNALALVYDFFEKNYNDVDVVSIPIKFFDRQTGNHILNYKYDSTRLVDLIKEPDHIQLSASASFIKKEAIKDYIFDPDLVVSEDAIFVNKILLEKRKMGVISGTSYYYRKRLLSDSTIDLSVESKDYYLQRSQVFFKELFNYSKSVYGEIFEFIKYTVAYDIQWIFDKNHVEDILGESDLETLKSFLYELLQEIDDEIILKQRHDDKNLKYHVLIFKHGGIDTQVFAEENNVKKVVNNNVIDELYYHVLYLNAFEIHKNKLTLTGFLKSYFLYPEVKIQAVKCEEKDFNDYWTRHVNERKTEFFKNEYLNNKGVHFKAALLDGIGLNDESLRELLNIKTEIDFDEFTENIEDNSDDYILNNINDDFTLDMIENEFRKRYYFDEETYIAVKKEALNEYLDSCGEIHESEKIEYPLKEKIFLDMNYIPFYNFEIEVPLKQCENSIIKLRVTHGSLNFYLDVDMENYCKLTRFSFYSKKDDYLVKFEDNSFKIKNYSLMDLLELEESNIKYFEERSSPGFKEIIRFRKHYYYSFFKYANKRIWLFMDRPDVADDNAEHLFKYAMQQNDGIDKYFVLREDSKDYERISKIGKVVNAGSEEHKLLACHAEKVISSQADAVVLNPFYEHEKFYNGLFSAKVYFLQHGVIKEDISSWLHKYDKYLYLILTSAKAEYDSFFNGKTQYNYDESVVQLLGLPRHDYREKLEDMKEIVIMPSWRRTLENLTEKQFKNSDFYKAYNSLLNDPELIEFLDERGYKIVFKPHHNLNEYLDYFDKNSIVEFDHVDSNEEHGNRRTYNDIFNHSSLLITDYSSVAFDFAYIKKPVIYFHGVADYHFDIEDSYFDYEEMGFGEIAKTQEGLINLIFNYINSNCEMKEKYKKRVDEFFEYNEDKNNCKRVYDFILNDSPHTQEPPEKYLKNNEADELKEVLLRWGDASYDNLYFEEKVHKERVEKNILMDLLKAKNNEINALNKTLDEKQAEMDSIRSSNSWKITKPLRKMISIIKKR